ncbi:hypothetical protein SEMRO_3102_G343790.1 [Seminavis robusta]|uniref:Uncharacterized protein n=1 Tax=Seminavis robusta TaxID=568900 RepID=A0A9N8F526_9STRA|nr:hypothetical protein SEMRO_3102_G343790.1 [Seminavis robusta]|eukprot:Sro3102_g343790.1 n/a (344) ;mRNA; f:3291-4322
MGGGRLLDGTSMPRNEESWRANAVNVMMAMEETSVQARATAKYAPPQDNMVMFNLNVASLIHGSNGKGSDLSRMKASAGEAPLDPTTNRASGRVAIGVSDSGRDTGNGRQQPVRDGVGTSVSGQEEPPKKKQKKAPPKKKQLTAEDLTRIRRAQFLAFCRWWSRTGDGSLTTSTATRLTEKDSSAASIAVVFNTAACPNYLIGALFHDPMSESSSPSFSWMEIDLKGTIVRKETTCRYGVDKESSSDDNGFDRLMKALVKRDTIATVATIDDWEDSIKMNDPVTTGRVVFLEQVPAWLSLSPDTGTSTTWRASLSSHGGSVSSDVGMRETKTNDTTEEEETTI